MRTHNGAKFEGNGPSLNSETFYQFFSTTLAQLYGITYFMKKRFVSVENTKVVESKNFVVFSLYAVYS